MEVTESRTLPPAAPGAFAVFRDDYSPQQHEAPTIRLNPQVVTDLARIGYRGLLPVAPPGATMSPNSHVEPGKVPSDRGSNGWRGVPNWPEQAYSTKHLQYQIVKYGAGLGINTTRHPFVDADVSDPELAAAIEGVLAGLMRFPLKRTGRAPKFAVPCIYALGTEPFPKMVLHLRDAAGRNRGMVEILSDKRFIVLAGNHPKTGAPYVWQKGEQVGGVELLAETPPESLPPISKEIVTEQLMPALAQALQPLGITISLDSGSQRTAKAAEVDQQSLLAPSLDALAEVVAAIPNNANHDDYVRTGRAIRAAAGEDHLREGYAIFEKWAAEGKDGLGGSHPPEVMWESLRPPHAIGWDYLCAKARAHGYNTGPFDFEADPSAVLAAPLTTPVPPVTVVLSTQGERLAAITGHPVRVLFSEATTLPDGELANRWPVLKAAASVADPLAELFHSEVIPVAAGLTAKDPDHFRARMAAGLRSSARWRNAPPADRELLLRAGWTDFAPYGALMASGARSRVPLVDLYADGEPRQWLVKGLIPSPGVASIVGAPGSCKTYIAGDLAGRVASSPLEGKPSEFMGRTVAAGSVLYFASEDPLGVRDRVKRWVPEYGDPRAHLRLISRAFPLSAPEEALRLLFASLDTLPKGVPLRLVVVDVFRDSLIGNENESEVVGAAMATAHLVSRLTGASVLLIHHASRHSPGSPRGSTAFDGACDLLASVERKDKGVLLTITKHRNGPPGETANWHVVDGVLRRGWAAGAGAASISEEEQAAMLARSLWSIGSADAPITPRELHDAVAAEHPSVFGDEVVSRGTRTSRISRAKKTAIERGWIAVHRSGKLIPGPVQPPPIAILPGNIEALL